MGWFESQIEERRAADQQLLEDSFVKIAGVVLGQRAASKISDARIIAKGAIDEILKYCHCKPMDIPESLQTTEEQLDAGTAATPAPAFSSLSVSCSLPPVRRENRGSPTPKRRHPIGSTPKRADDISTYYYYNNTAWKKQGNVPDWHIPRKNDKS